MSKFPQQVSIVEVGARDGLQNETAVIELPVKLAFIDGLGRAGLKRI
ncbi:MAG TPA: hydroxymethylglutaryl-CoA lyase, partial [Alteromonas sp.]|nr:hydroxymethylglutaryl-CoA lyase [Alteromonas sp.]